VGHVTDGKYEEGAAIELAYLLFGFLPETTNTHRTAIIVKIVSSNKNLSKIISFDDRIFEYTKYGLP